MIKKLKGSILMRKRNLREKMQEIQEGERQIVEEIFNLMQECNHEIVYATIPEYSSTNVTIVKSKTICLLCGQNLSPRKDSLGDLQEKLDKAVCISLEDYPLLLKKWEDNYVLKLEECYFEESGKKESMYQIGIRMKDSLKEQEIIAQEEQV